MKRDVRRSEDNVRPGSKESQVGVDDSFRVVVYEFRGP